VVFGLLPRGLPGLVFATTAREAGVINAAEFSAVVVMVAFTTVIGLLLLDRRLMRLAAVAPDPPVEVFGEPNGTREKSS
jgi:Kef-type K+ transport system membrane component KefB